MAGNDAEFKTFVDARQAEAEIVKLHKRIDSLGAATKRAGRTSRQSADEGARGWKAFNSAIDRAIAKQFTLNNTVNVGMRIFRAAGNEARRLAERAQEVFDQASESELKLQIQAGLTPAGLEKQIPSIRKALITTPSATADEGLLLQTQLASSGFRKQDVESGAALQAALDLKAATNQFGRNSGDVAGSVKSISQFLKALGDATPSAQSIRSTGGKLTTLFEGSDIQFPDLSNLAPKAAGLKSLGISEDVQLAAFSSLVDQMGGELGATALTRVATGLRAAGSNKKATEGIQSLGLKPEDIDLIGEDLPTALETLKGALSKAGEKTGSDALLGMFGKEGAPSAATLLGSTDTIRKRLGMLQGDAFERNVATFQNSTFARRQAKALDEEFKARDQLMAGGGPTWGEVDQDINKAYGDRLRNASGGLERLGLLSAMVWDKSLAWGFETVGRQPSDLGMEVRDVRAEYGIQPNNHVMRRREDDAMQEQNELLREMNASIKQNRPPIRRDAHTE